MRVGGTRARIAPRGGSDRGVSGKGEEAVTVWRKRMPEWVYQSSGLTPRAGADLRSQTDSVTIAYIGVPVTGIQQASVTAPSQP